MKINKLKKYDGIIIPGGFGNSGVNGKIKAIKFIRENNIPYLGLCYGMQLAIIEFSRNVCNLKGANSIEIDKKTKYPVIDILPKQKEILKKKNYGNSMRLGNYEAILIKHTKVYNSYKKLKVIERHRHRYEVNIEYINKIEQKGGIFSGKNKDLMEFFEIKKHKFFVSTQAHPEFNSRLEKPSPLFSSFIRTCLK